VLFDLFRRGHTPILDGEHLRHLAFIISDEEEERRRLFQEEDGLRPGIKLKLRLAGSLTEQTFAFFEDAESDARREFIGDSIFSAVVLNPPITCRSIP
jgi:hypothetical protein